LFIYCRHGAGKSRGQYRADERATNGVISTNSNRPHQRERPAKQTVRQLTDDALRSTSRTVITSQKVMLSDGVSIRHLAMSFMMLRRSFQSYYATDGILLGWRVWARPWSISKNSSVAIRVSPN
jgi:hypothetical protein